MMRAAIIILFLLFAEKVVSQGLRGIRSIPADYSSDISASMNFSKMGGLNGTNEYGGTFSVGMTWYKQISKGKYTVNSINPCAGLFFNRTGYNMSAYSPLPNEAYYDKYGVNHIVSKFKQNFVTAGIGIDFQFRFAPVTSPRAYSSVKLMLNNSMLLFSTLKEEIDYDQERKSSLTNYANKYAPGLTLEAKIQFVTIGVTWKSVKYKIPEGALNISDEIGSPFHEIILKNERYSDFYMYFGIAVRVKSERAKMIQ